MQLPERSRTAFLGERPFLPIGPLRKAIAFPSRSERFSDEQIREALGLVDLAPLADRLDEVGHWEQHLSAGEQQRLAFVRVLLHRPEWIFLDGATSSLDEESEARIYELLRTRLPRTAVVSIADRPSIVRHHERRLSLVKGAGSSMVLQPA
jgi:putative ATP-binding cassette transporter